MTLLGSRLCVGFEGDLRPPLCPRSERCHGGLPLSSNEDGLDLNWSCSKIPNKRLGPFVGFCAVPVEQKSGLGRFCREKVFRFCEEKKWSELCVVLLIDNKYSKFCSRHATILQAMWRRGVGLRNGATDKMCFRQGGIGALSVPRLQIGVRYRNCPNLVQQIVLTLRNDISG